MEHAGLDFLRFALVPEILSEISAGAARDVHAALILIMTLGALPLVVVVDEDLSVKAAHVAVVALGIELGVLNVVVNEANDVLKRVEVVVYP